MSRYHLFQYEINIFFFLNKLINWSEVELAKFLKLIDALTRELISLFT